MNLAWHQFRKDLRQFRVFLSIWGGLVLLDLAVNLGWVGQVVYSSPGGFDHASNAWTALLPIVLWMLIAVLPSLAVLADSPARREGFLATRPLPKRDLLLAKMLFVLGLIVAPWVLQELVHLVWQGMPAWVIAQGTLERLLFTLPVAVGFGAYAALWPSHGRWARALAGTLVGSYLLLLIVVAVSNFVFHTRSVPFNSGFAVGLVGAYGFVLALVTLAVWHSRVHPGVLGRWSGLVLAVLSYCLTAWLCPRDFLALRPANPAEAISLMADVGFEIPPRSMSFQKEQDPDRAGPAQFNVNLTPRTKPLPAGRVVAWSSKDASLTRASGGESRGDSRSGRAPLFTTFLWNPSYCTADFAAWASEFPGDVLFRLENQFMPSPRGDVQAGKFNLPTNREALTEPLMLRAGFDARVFQWRKLADLPLTPGATATDEFGSWEFIGTESSRAGQPGTRLYCRRRQIELATARDSRCSTAHYGPLARLVFMVHDPLQHVVWLPQSAASSATRATHTALAQRFVTLYFYTRKLFTPEELARCRLIVFEKTWLGSVPETWQSPTFTLDEALPPLTGAAVANNDPMPRAEFNRRVAALKVPAPDAPRREVSLHLLEFLRLVDARRTPLAARDPHTAQLARFVPAHLDLLLDGLPAMSWTSKRSVLNALQLGVTDAQRPAIIAALPHEPELAEVLLARGWVENARAEILQLVKSRHGLPLSAIRAIAWFRDPQSYPRLLEEFESHLSVAEDDLLHALGLDTQLDTIVHQRWREESLVLRQSPWQMSGDALKLAFRHGETSALRRAYLLLDDPVFDRASGELVLADALRSGVQMPGLSPEKRQNYEAVLAWMRKHRPEDFVFNPARRQFVLKENLTTRKPVAGQNP